MKWPWNTFSDFSVVENSGLPLEFRWYVSYFRDISTSGLGGRVTISGCRSSSISVFWTSSGWLSQICSWKTTYTDYSVSQKTAATIPTDWQSLEPDADLELLQEVRVFSRTMLFQKYPHVQKLRQTAPFGGIFLSKLPQDVQSQGLCAPRFDGTWAWTVSSNVPKELALLLLLRGVKVSCRLWELALF